jgi:hypothetical protein
LEDITLQKELPGYAEYTKKVKLPAPKNQHTSLGHIADYLLIVIL